MGSSAFSELNLERMRKLMPQSEDDPDEAAHAQGLGAHGGTYGRQIFEPIEESEQ